MALIDAGMEEWGNLTRFSTFNFATLQTSRVAGPWSRYSVTANGYLELNFGAQLQQVFAGGRFYFTTTAVAKAIWDFREANLKQVKLQTVAGGQLVVVDNWDNVLATSAGFALSANRWYFIECRVLVANTGGIVQVWVDEQLRINFTGDTQSSGNPWADRIRYLEGTADVYLDDPYVLDTTGTVNNSRLGDVACAGLAVTGAGDAAQFTPVGAAANWDCVDEIPPDDATTYVQSSTLDQRDLHALEDLPQELTDVKAVVLAARAQKSDAGAANISLGVKYDADGNGVPDTESWGPDEALSTSWAYHRRVLDLHPDGTGWTRAKLNALQVGYKAR